MKRYLPLLLALGLGACGSSGSPSEGGRAATTAAQATVTRTVSASTTTTSSTTSAASSSTSSTTASGGAGISSVPCTASNLSLSFVGEDDAAGHGLLKFALKNTGSTPCHTFGFPGVAFLDAHGATLATVPHHITSDYFGPAPEGKVTIAPGQIGSFRIGVTHGAIPGSVCTTAYGLQVIPPDDTATLHVSIANGAYECRDASVSPIEPGPTAYGQ